MKHVVMFSGGAGSWAAAKRVAARHGTSDMVLLFTDTKTEDHDLYRFLQEAAANVGAPLVSIADGRTIWDVFHDEGFLGNNRVAICSRILKRDVANGWLKEHCDPADTIVYVGIDWTEEHRYTKLRDIRAAEGWRYEAPLCEPPYIDKEQVLADLDAAGIARPRLYRLGFAHNNCGGGCVRAGIGHFAHLHRTLPRVYALWEKNEERLRQHFGKDVAILRDRRGGTTKPLPLAQLRRRLEKGQSADPYEIGGCGCFVEMEDAA